ncbi:MAG: 8-amino-7-oxononanoate synthase [Elusimicrobiota bacterium]|nr:8-amino-7-oxononanoate synthase [Elusimicrobiota bacterium]
MDFIEEELEKIKKNQIYRKIFGIRNRNDNMHIEIDGIKYIDFSSNDYLNLSNHPEMVNVLIESAQKYGVGTGGSRLLGGGFELHNELENKIANFKLKEAALFFNSGYQANIGLIQALYKKGDVIFVDKLIHASIIDGIRLSGIDFFRFKHNDIDDLKSKLEKNRENFKRTLIITESVFSMDGDIANLCEIAKLKDKYDFQIFVDEAHATGIFGKNGSGIVEELDLIDKIDFIMGTFSKALGSFGAYIACQKSYKEYLINKCRSFIFSTSLPLSIVSANIKSIDIIQNEPIRRIELKRKVNYIRNLFKKSNIKILGETQIIPIILKDNKKAIKISEKLKDLGYWVQPIRYPTVPKNQARLRLSINFNHSDEILEKFVEDCSKLIL